MQLEMNEGCVTESKSVDSFDDIMKELRKFAGRDTSIKKITFKLEGYADVTHNVYGVDIK